MRSFVKRLPARTGAQVAIRVEAFDPDTAHLAREACLEWHEEVQPFIRYNSSRRDRHWNWPMIASLMFHGAGDKSPKIFVLRAVYPAGTAPVAILALLEHARWVTNAEQQAVCVWRLSTAPPMVLPRLVELPEGSGPPRLLGRAALDVATTVAIEGNARGRIWMSVGTGNDVERLAFWLALENGLCRLPPGAAPLLPAMPGIERLNVGQCFVHTPATAQWAHAEMDPWRQVSEEE